MTNQAQLKSWLTTQEVGEMFDVPPRVVLRMIRENRLQATKMGWQWVINKSDVPDTWPPPVKKAKQSA